MGRRFAEEVGYAGDILDRLPPGCIESFTGVSNLSILADIPPGAAVLDVGCGAGLDSFVAETRTGASGRVVGIDFSRSMIAKAEAAARTLGSAVHFHCTDAENIPVPDASFDIVLVNGIFNLNPDRDALFHEVARVVRKGGLVYAAELILQQPQRLPPSRDIADWFS